MMPLTPHPEIYSTFWRFAAERQAIFHRRAAGFPPPWTDDPILTRYRFTNAYRASDRVSQYLIQRVIYLRHAPSPPELFTPEEVFFRTVLFKLFNLPSTWEFLCSRQGAIPTWADWSARGGYDHTLALLDLASECRMTLINPAYMMPGGNNVYGHRTKRGDFLGLLWHLMTTGVPSRLASATNMGQAFQILRSQRMLGNFLAYQLATDLAYSPVFDWSEMDFVEAGPGALDGLSKVFNSLGNVAPNDAIRMLTHLQEYEFHPRELTFLNLWGRPLQLIDVQNLLCEISKYTRASHPHVVGASGRTNIKQTFKPSKEPPVNYWFPPKWGINEHLPLAPPFWS